MTIRFHLDEHVHPAIAVGLRSHGFDVTTTADAGLLESDDPQHLVYALAQNRVVVTHDDDFLKLHNAGAEHAGVAYCLPSAEVLRGRAPADAPLTRCLL